MPTRLRPAALPLLAAALLACDRHRPSAAARPAATPAVVTTPVRGLGERGLPLVADAGAVTSVDSAGLGGVPLCAPLAAVARVFPSAVDEMVYCPEDGCDTPYPARIALTGAGDTLVFESRPTGAGTDHDGEPRVHYAVTTSPRVRGPLGARPGMTVGQVLALGETVEVDTAEVIVAPPQEGYDDTLRVGPNVLRLRLRRQGLVAEVWDSVDARFTRRLTLGRPAREALDTAARLRTLGAERARCP